MLGSRHPEQGLGAVEEEPGQGQDGEHHHRRGGRRQELQDDQADGDQAHLDGADPVGLAAEEAVGDPAGAEHARTAGDLEDADRPARQLRGQRDGHLPEEGRSPVQDRETDDIDEEVRHGERPDDRIEEDLLADEGAVGLRGVVLVQFGPGVRQFRQPDRGRGVPQGRDDEEDTGRGDGAGHPEAGPPVARRADEVAAEDGQDAGADRVRGVPDGRFRRQFPRGAPMVDEPVARREAAPLEDVVQHQQDAHDDDHRPDEIRSAFLPGDEGGEAVAPSEEEVQDDAGSEADDQVPAGVEAVGDEAVHEL